MIVLGPRRLRDWRVVAVPGVIITFFLFLGGSIIAFDIKATTSSHNGPFKNTLILDNRLSSAMFFTSFGYNWIVTGLMIGRLTWAHKRLNSHINSRSTGDYIKVIVALVESGFMYTLFMLGYFIANYAGDVSLHFTHGQ